VLKRAVVLFQTELAQAKKRVRGAVLRREAKHLPERVAAVFVVVERVIRGSAVPLAFDVSRPQLQRFVV
jgi:hypothetical protein